MTGHFPGFISRYAQIVRPLDRLKQKDVEFEWTLECEKAFQTLKDLISRNPILHLPDRSLPYELCTDACNYDTEAILYQRDPNKKKLQQLRVIGYHSHTFTSAEKNYSITDEEALAIIKAIEYFRSYLEGHKFTVRTDHFALKYLLRLKDPKGRLARWQSFLMGYDLEIDHRPGRLLTDADAISRLCPDRKGEVLIIEKNLPFTVTTEHEKRDILQHYHDDQDSGGHDGFWRTYFKIKLRFKWRGMEKEIFDYVRSCHMCQIGKPRRFPDIPVAAPHSTIPFHTVHLDFGELRKRSALNGMTRSFLLLVDEATRVTTGRAMREDTHSFLDFLNYFEFLKYKVIKVIVTDNGPAFTSKTFINWTKSKNIQLKNAAPYHPASNGLVERKKRDIKQFYHLYEKQGGDWKATIAVAMKHSNRTYSSALDCTPLYKLTKEPTSLPADRHFQIEQEDLHETTKDCGSKPKYHKYHGVRHSRSIGSQKGDKIIVHLGHRGKTSYRV